MSNMEQGNGGEESATRLSLLRAAWKLPHRVARWLFRRTERWLEMAGLMPDSRRTVSSRNWRRRGSKRVRKHRARKPIAAHRGEMLGFSVPKTIPDTINVYIDEAWPASGNEGEPSIGIIAGIVWMGAKPEYGTLRHVRTHLHASGEHALKRLLECEKAFPFAFQVQLSPKRSPKSNKYLRMLSESVILLLGWVLKRPPGRTAVFIHAERYAPFGVGTDGTSYFRKLIAAESATPTAGRFSEWSIAKVEWREKPFEYIPYADLVGYLFAKTHAAKRMAEKFRVSEWPGCVTITPDLLTGLREMDAGTFPTAATESVPLLRAT